MRRLFGPPARTAPMPSTAVESRLDGCNRILPKKRTGSPALSLFRHALCLLTRSALPGIMFVSSLMQAQPDTGLTLTFAARRPIHEDGHETSWAGHAYIIIGTKTSSGIKEDILGFYPKKDSIANVLKGPGLLKAEYRCSPTDDCAKGQEATTLKRLSETAESFKVPITAAQLRAIYAEVAVWNGKNNPPDYEIANRNCQDFLAAVATAIGYPVPPVHSLTVPLNFIRSLRALVDLEDQRRAIEAKVDKATAELHQTELRLSKTKEETARAESNLRTAQAQLRAIDEQIRSKQDATARAVPPGWVRCRCPQTHSYQGKVIDGTRWHPNEPPDCPPGAP